MTHSQTHSREYEEFLKRQAARPDQWTLAWWQEQFREVIKAYQGATHSINLAHANYENCDRDVLELKARCEAMESDRHADRAKIGELQARVERMAAFLNQQKNGWAAGQEKMVDAGNESG